VINVASINLLALLDFAFGHLGLQITGEAFYAGRGLGTEALYASLRDKTFVQFLFGSGPGACDAAMISSSGGTMLTHNDWLRIYYDYGIAGSFVFTACLASLYAFSRVTLVLGCAFAVLMSTDNVLIYLFVQFPIAYMFAAERSRLSLSNAPAHDPQVTRIRHGGHHSFPSA
jgi:hypothetical protein